MILINSGNLLLYLLFPDCTWYDAREYCESQNGQLAEISTTDTFNFVKFLAKNVFKTGNWWVGASDERTEGTWLWKYSKIVVEESMWQSGQPNEGTVGNCGYLLGNSYELGDASCTSTGSSRPLCQQGKLLTCLLLHCNF